MKNIKKLCLIGRQEKSKIKINSFDSGFTLVELLVVIAIIGILAAIVMVSLGSTRDRARVASLQSTMASITTIANLCVNDGGDVQAPTNAATGQDGAGVSVTICDDTTASTEIWPNLSTIQGLNSRGLYIPASIDSTTITAGIDSDGDGTVESGDTTITCTVSTGSCQRGTLP